MHFAMKIIGKYGDLDFSSNTPEFILGSTSPDIRVITKKDRSIYHFVSLDFERLGDGLRNMQEKHGAWKQIHGKDLKSRAFMAGYASHLILDETWITSMFRRYFSDNRIFIDSFEGLVMDRALQLELDRRYWSEMGSNLQSFGNADTDINVLFLQNEPIAEWQSWVTSLLDREFSWDRLLFMAKRISKGHTDHPAVAITNEFVSDPNAGIDLILNKLPSGVLDQFAEESRTNMSLALEVLYS